MAMMAGWLGPSTRSKTCALYDQSLLGIDGGCCCPGADLVGSACRYAAVTSALGERCTLTEDKHDGSRHSGGRFPLGRSDWRCLVG